MNATSPTAPQEEIILPFETKYLQDLFEQISFKIDDIGQPPTATVKGKKVEIGPACIVALPTFPIGKDAYTGGGRMYLFVRPKQDVIDHLQYHLRLDHGGVYFQIKIKGNSALVVAVQGPDKGPAHLIACVRADSIPEPEDAVR